MKQYLDLLQNILDNGREKESGRENMPNTFGLSRGTILMENVNENFPLLTTKKMFWKGIVHELLWFLRGETNIKYLVDNNVNIWNGDAYRWYQKQCDDRHYRKFASNMDSFLDYVRRGHRIKFNDGVTYTYGDLGKVYGYQWRNQNGVDQIYDILKDLKETPYGRYKILDSWNKRDFPEMALPPCHLLYQFIVRPMTNEERWKIAGLTPNMDEFDYCNKLCDDNNVSKFFLDLNMYQRSCDTFLGVPFNLASMSLLLMIIAKANNMVAGDAFWIGGDVHLYMDHISVVKDQIARNPKNLPQMIIKKDLNSLDDITSLKIEDFELINYESYGKLKAELFTGNKK